MKLTFEAKKTQSRSRKKTGIPAGMKRFFVLLCIGFLAFSYFVSYQILHQAVPPIVKQITEKIKNH